MSNEVNKKWLKRPRSEWEKDILKMMIDNDLSYSDIARYYGCVPSNASARALRGDKEYFKKAVDAINAERKSKRRSA